MNERDHLPEFGPGPMPEQSVRTLAQVIVDDARHLSATEVEEIAAAYLRIMPTLTLATTLSTIGQELPRDVRESVANGLLDSLLMQETPDDVDPGMPHLSTPASPSNPLGRGDSSSTQEPQRPPVDAPPAAGTPLVITITPQGLILFALPWLALVIYALTTPPYILK